LESPQINYFQNYFIQSNQMKQTITHSIILLIFSFVVLSSNMTHAQCNAPSNLQYSYSNNVSTFTWDAVPGAFSYTIQLKYPSYDWTNLEYEETVTSNTLAMTGIMQSITLDWRVQANCVSGGSTYTQSTSPFIIPCPEPLGLNVTNITTTGATLNWTPAVGYSTFTSDFVLGYRLAGTTNNWTSLGHTFNSTKNITGLLAGTTYEWCVNQTCAYANSNPVISTFTTAVPPCNAPTGLASTNVSPSQADVSWTAVTNALSYSVEYKTTTATTWTTAIITSTTSYTITGLTASTQYDWRVKTNCTGGSSAYTAAQMTTPNLNSCGVPASLNVTNLGNTNATMNWLPVSGATSYTLYYKMTSISSWLIVNGITSTAYVKTGLSLNTPYEYKVRANCSAGSGVFSPVATFTTLNCVSFGNNTNEWIDLFNIGSINRTSGAEVGGYANTGVSTNLTIGSIGNATRFSAGFAGAVRNQNMCIYIDLNRNGSFDEANERVYGAAFVATAGIINFTVNIPSTATPGITAMRVIMSKNGSGAITGCFTGFQGETEDYTVNLVTPTARLSAEISGNFAENIVENEAIILAYPNPSSGVFRVTLSSTIEPVSYQVVNLTGNVLQKNSMEKNEELNIDISRASNGMYLLRVLDKEGKQHIQKLYKE
jgi:hypothetical protein